MKSLKELFRIGHGPSSSHTMAPAEAAEIFKKRFPDAPFYEVTLYGSLAATGKGHFTDQAIIKHLAPGTTEIVWNPDTVLPFHPNGMLFKAFDKEHRELGKAVFYSTGGGALSEEGVKDQSEERYPFKNMQEIISYCREEGIPLWEVVRRFDHEDIMEYLEKIAIQMEQSIETGLMADGVLPGGLRLARKARNVYLKSRSLRQDILRTGMISAYSYAVAEENASLGIVVTAPTCGSCGVVPSVLRYCRETRPLSRREELHALATAGLVGNVVKQNGSISGAEVGCQGEIGVACAMASAAAAAIFGGTVPQIEYAAEIGLEHFLGLTCDPVMGLVQIPCIERNAIAANRAVVSAEMALLSDGVHFISFDTVVQTMLQTGKDMPSLYRETSEGGLSRFAKIK
ncbi:MAG: L-serine ammonia-lyase [Lentisphaeria bacterium]|nr:L-serine ammonia-lyase [Lentisphaeria bacterium]